METVNNVLIIDANPVIRAGLHQYLSDTPGIEVSGMVKNIAFACSQFKKSPPGIIFLGLKMQGADNLKSIQKLKKTFPLAKILCLSLSLEGDTIRAAIEAGALGFMSKSAEKNDILVAIESLLNGKTHFSTEAAFAVLDNLTSQSPTDSQNLIAPLSKRETQVLLLVAEDMSNQDIADKLGISPRTVEVHKRNLLDKTGANHMAGLVMFAIRNGIIQE